MGRPNPGGSGGPLTVVAGMSWSLAFVAAVLPLLLLLLLFCDVKPPCKPSRCVLATRPSSTSPVLGLTGLPCFLWKRIILSIPFSYLNSIYAHILATVWFNSFAARHFVRTAAELQQQYFELEKNDAGVHRRKNLRNYSSFICPASLHLSLPLLQFWRLWHAW